MFHSIRSKVAAGATAMVGGIGSVMAETDIDVSAAESALGDVATAVGVIGVAMVAAAAAGIAYRWVTAFLVK